MDSSLSVPAVRSHLVGELRGTYGSFVIHVSDRASFPSAVRVGAGETEATTPNQRWMGRSLG